MTKLARISYIFIAVALILVGWLKLTTLVLTLLFASFALNKLNFSGRKWIAISLFTVLVTAIGYGFVFFVKEALDTLPKIAHTSIPMIIDYAAKHGVDVGFTDLQTLKARLLTSVTEELRYFGNLAKLATRELAILIIAFVVSISIFLNARFQLGEGPRNNLYSLFCDELAARFGSFYRSFELVMGAQLIISSINTTLTAIFVLTVGLPYAGVIIVVTFLCGLLPIIGNIVSNTITVAIAFTVSPHMALGALAFLVVVHKLEYFLNSKIIGERIKNPVWFTLIALILGERLMGIPGMILAPVVLHFIKMEASSIKVPTKTPELAEPTPEEFALKD
ncbi:MAG TPA: AI-2E family transporter [Verrucomicrobiae bacterium]|nr:AI-2E family transporter [Verrucomicrobiae bacterium]